MYITGYGFNTSYYDYLQSSVNKTGLTSDSLNPVGDVLTQKTRGISGTREAYTPSITGNESSSDFQDIMKIQYKLLKEQEYDEELEEARISDPAKYNKMQTERKQDIAKSFRQVEELARESGDGKTGVAVHNGVPITFDFEHGVMTVGDMSAGNDIIHVGKLSNGYAFSFNRDNIGDISKILDLFSPEDVNKIMEAITTDNIAKSMEQEIEDEKAKVGKTAETDANSTQSDVSQGQTADAGSNNGLDMLSPAIEDLDQSAAVGGKNGIGFSIYYMNRAQNAYEDSFVYAR